MKKKSLAQQIIDTANENSIKKNRPFFDCVERLIDANDSIVDEKFFDLHWDKSMYIFDDSSAVILIDEEDVQATTDKKYISSVKKELKERKIKEEQSRNKFYDLNREYTGAEFDLYF